MPDVHEIMAEAEMSAERIYSAVLERFLESTSRLDRDKDENVYKLQLGKFGEVLKHELEFFSRTVIAGYDGILNERLGQSLQQMVLNYQDRFVRQAEAS